MNEVFSFRRWLLLVKKHWAENRKMYFLALPAIAGLMFAWYSLILIAAPGKVIPLAIQYVTYYTGLLLVGCLYASTMFADLGEKNKAIQFMLLPASTLEKLVCGLFFCVFLFFIFYTIIFYLVDIPMVKLTNGNLPSQVAGLGTKEINEPAGIINIFSNFGGELEVGIPVFLLSSFIVQSIYILGSVYFPKSPFIKTTVFLFIAGLLIFILSALLDSLLPDNWHMREFIQWTKYNGMLQSENVRLADWAQIGLLVLIWYSPSFVFWFITYIRLKEKEV